MAESFAWGILAGSSLVLAGIFALRLPAERAERDASGRGRPSVAPPTTTRRKRLHPRLEEENPMPSDHEPTYGLSTSWQPERPRLRLFPLLVSWIATAVALMVAAWILPGVNIENFGGALVVAAIVAVLNAVIPRQQLLRL